MRQDQQMVATGNGGGIGFFGLLTLLFVALKLTGVIGWSWWWVLSPLLIAAGLWLVGVIVIMILAIVYIRNSR